MLPDRNGGGRKSSIEATHAHNLLIIQGFRRSEVSGTAFAMPETHKRMEQPPPSTRPETAAELLDLLLRSRWFADSLFGQLLDQSRDYLARPAQEFAIALVEKRCLSPWQATELLAGRNCFYRGGFRLIEQISVSKTAHFIAEQVRPSRLVILEVASDAAGEPAQRVFEFEAGWLLSQRIRDSQFSRELLDQWRAQVELLLATLSPMQLEFVSPDRVLVDGSQTLKCLQPLGRKGVSEPEVARAELLAAAARRFSRSFDEATERIESVLWSPAITPSVPAGRSRYLPLLRKGPSWTAIEELSPDLQWEPRSDHQEAAADLSPEPIPVAALELSIDELQKVQTAQDPTPVQAPKRLRRLGWVAATLAVIAVIAAGWIGGRTWANRLRAGEGPKKTPVHSPPHSLRPAEAPAKATTD